MGELREESNPWRDSRFRIFAGGNLINNLGEGMYAFALPLLALQYTGSLAAMAFLVAVSPLVIALAGPILGHVVDRFGSRVLVLPGLGLQAVSALLLNLYLLSGDAPLWALYVAEIGVQLGAAAYRGGWIAGVAAMFPESPGRARGSMTVVFQISLVAGPALAALLVVPLGFPGLLWINNATFLAPVIVWLCGINPAAGQAASRGFVAVSLRQSMVEGLEVFKRGGKMGTLMALMVPSSLAFSGGTLTLYVFFLSDEFKSDPATIGASLALVNVGGLASAIIVAELPRWRMRRLAIGSLLVAVVTLATTGLAAAAWLATLAIIVFVMCDNAISVATEMEMFSSVPVELMGRTLGFWRLATGLPAFVAPSVIGILGHYFGARVSFLFPLAACLVPLLWLLMNRSALTAAGTSTAGTEAAKS